MILCMRSLFGYFRAYCLPVQMFQDVRDYRHFRFSQLQVSASLILLSDHVMAHAQTQTNSGRTRAEDIELLKMLC